MRNPSASSFTRPSFPSRSRRIMPTELELDGPQARFVLADLDEGERSAARDLSFAEDGECFVKRFDAELPGVRRLRRADGRGVPGKARRVQARARRWRLCRPALPADVARRPRLRGHRHLPPRRRGQDRGALGRAAGRPHRVGERQHDVLAAGHTSIRRASPWPPPEQIAASPSPPPLRRRSCTIVATMRPPEAPIGCPSATAPPFTFTFASSAPRSLVEFHATDENASLISTRSTSSIVFPARSRAIAPAFAGVRARKAKSSATYPCASTVASGSIPRLRAHSSLVTITQEAPSFTPGALPAVVVPSASTTGSRDASFSSEVSRRGLSSVATPSTPTISSSKRPASIAATARSCERYAHAS